MTIATLEIKLPDGQRREHPVEQPQVTLGRAPDNDAVILHETVSRRHARLIFDSEWVLVEDLGSFNGTFMGDERLGANQPRQLRPGEVVRLGEVEVSYSLPPPPPEEETLPTLTGEELAAATETHPGVDAGRLEQQVEVVLSIPPPPVLPGNTSNATLLVRNIGPGADEFIIRLVGLPADWYQLREEQIFLAPGEEHHLTLRFQPPRRPEARAGEHRFSVTLYSRQHGRSGAADGTLQVLPYHSFSLEIQPVLGAGDFQVIPHNQGNVPQTYHLAGRDDANNLDFSFERETVVLQPGQREIVPLQAALAVRPIVGPREVRPFTVIATAAEEEGGQARVNGQMVVQPVIPIWAIPVALLLLLCACVTTAYAYAAWCQGFPGNLPFCPASPEPIIHAFTAEPAQVMIAEPVLIRWQVSNAERVELLASAMDFHMEVEVEGEQSFTLDQNTIFTLRASNPAGTVEETVTVEVIGAPPAIQQFTIEPNTYVRGQTESVVISWMVIGAETVRIEGLPEQELPHSGSVNIPAPQADQTFALLAANQAGSVRQDVTVFVAPSGCVIGNIPADQQAGLHEGPSSAHPVVVLLPFGTPVEPNGRTTAADWLRVQALGRQGWVASANVNCLVDLAVFPIVDPGQIPPAPPTPTDTPTITPTITLTPEEPTPTPTPTITPTPITPEPPTPTPTATEVEPSPIITAPGIITYRRQTATGITIFSLTRGGTPVPLVANVSDAAVLDYTAEGGGRFAIWVLEGTAHSVHIVRPNGERVGGPLNRNWETVVDASWSLNGQRLVVEAVTAGSPAYYFFNNNGEFLGQPTFP